VITLHVVFLCLLYVAMVSEFHSDLFHQCLEYQRNVGMKQPRGRTANGAEVIENSHLNLFCTTAFAKIMCIIHSEVHERKLTEHEIPRPTDTVFRST
jgi:hypothetical protein